LPARLRRWARSLDLGSGIDVGAAACGRGAPAVAGGGISPARGTAQPAAGWLVSAPAAGCGRAGADADGGGADAASMAKRPGASRVPTANAAPTLAFSSFDQPPRCFFGGQNLPLAHRRCRIEMGAIVSEG
jgi:hypothetical protein